MLSNTAQLIVGDVRPKDLSVAFVLDIKEIQELPVINICAGCI